MAQVVESLLDSAKRRSFAPVSQKTFEDADLISMANEELRLSLVSSLVKVREDFFLTTETVSIKAGVANYAIPSRAIGNSLKSLFYVADSTTRPVELSLVDSSDQGSYDATAAAPSAFYIEGDEIVLLPKPLMTQGSIVFSFAANPNELISTSSCAKISASTTNTTTVTFTVDTDLTASFGVGTLVDVLCATSPFKLWSYRVPVVSVTATTIELNLTDVQDAAGTLLPEVGDYICPTGYANIPQIPVAYHVVLAQMVAIRMLEGIGDLNKQKKAEETLGRLMSEALELVLNRVQTSPKKISKRGRLMRYFT